MKSSEKYKHDNADESTDNNNTADAEEIEKKEKIVQFLVKGVWIFKSIAPNVTETTVIARIEDTGT